MIIVGVPLLLFIVLYLLTMLKKGPRPPSYTLAGRWTHAPVLWAATDEVVWTTNFTPGTATRLDPDPG